MFSINELCNYDDIKNKISLAKTFSEVTDIYNKYVAQDKNYNNSLENILIKSLVDETKYKKKIEDIEFCDYIKRGDYNLYKLTDDIAQINVLNRINNKSRPATSLRWLTKKCPHCNKEFKNATNDAYVVCGYDVKGYDWKGCKKDWCFQCGKKLCKAWDTDELYNINNRYHGSCCKKFAKKNNMNPEEFCSCNKI